MTLSRAFLRASARADVSFQQRFPAQTPVGVDARARGAEGGPENVVVVVVVVPQGLVGQLQSVERSAIVNNVGETMLLPAKTKARRTISAVVAAN